MQRGRFVEINSFIGYNILYVLGEEKGRRMTTEEIKKGTVIYQASKPVNEIAVISSGNVTVTAPCGEYTAKEGDVLGICELASVLHYYTYTAASDVSLRKYKYKKTDLPFIADIIPEFADIAVTSGIEQINDITALYTMACMSSAEITGFLKEQYASYVELCEKIHVQPREMTELENMDIPDCSNTGCHYFSGYYDIIRQITDGSIFASQPDFVDGFLKHLGSDAEELFRAQQQLNSENKKVCALIAGDEKNDLLGCYTELLSDITQGNPAVKLIEEAAASIKMELDSCHYVDEALYTDRINKFEARMLKLPGAKKTEQRGNIKESRTVDHNLADSLDTILTFADCGSEISSAFKSAVKAYKELPDCDSLDDNAGKIRHTISSLFYHIYMQAFQVSIGKKTVPLPVKMFLDFGYVDEELAGTENTEYLAKLATEKIDSPKDKVYSFYNWLLAIYHGERMPSRNEFDMDFTESVHARRMKGEIDKDTETRLMNDRAQMVMYELQNLFPSAEKMTYGRITVFTGIFAEKDVIGDLASRLVTVNEIREITDDVRKRDFSVFYHDVLFSKPEVGISKDFIHAEVTPDIILMPVVGTRGVMWQEIEGKRRMSEARIMLPVFMLEELRPVLIHTFGEYRWEMCKRVQGAFWNDITDPSLTSEYFDYVQFYKKNQDLSQDMKDKLKIALTKAKNSYKEMFVRDYITWIIFESDGLPRLNKVARDITFKYCPFCHDIREKLRSNPMYENELRYFDLHVGQKKHHFKNVVQEINNLGKEVPEEINAETRYLEL